MKQSWKGCATVLRILSEMWGGSTATPQIASGVESCDLLNSGSRSSSSSVSLPPPSDVEVSTCPESLNADDSIDGDCTCGETED